MRFRRSSKQRHPQEIIRWAVDTFAPDIAMSTSFQTQSMALLHMATHIMPELRIFFLDTGYHFWDTLIFREKIQHEWNLNVIDLYRDSRWDIFARQNTRVLPCKIQTCAVIFIKSSRCKRH